MGLIIIDEATKLAAKNLAKFAADPDNRYRPKEHDWIPGDRPEYVMQFQTYTVVFTMTQMGDLVCRHMSISAHNEHLFPNPIAIFTICTMLGFTGGKTTTDITTEPGEDWSIVSQHTPRKSTIVAQRIHGE